MSALVDAARAIRGAFGERRGAGGSDPWQIPAPGDARGLLSSAGTAVSTESAMSQITFYRGVQILCDAVSGLPIRAVRQDADGHRTPVRNTPDAITKPFVAFNLREGLSQIVSSMAIRGNAYLAAVAWSDDYRLVPSQWRILHPDQVVVRFGADGERQYTVNGQLWTHQMMHLAGFMLPGAVKGAGIIEYTRNALGLGLALDDVAGEFFRNGVMSTGVIGVDATLTPDDAKAIAEQFKQNHSGVRRAHLPVVMGGGAKYTPISLTPEDAQFIESRQFHAGQMATLLGIPPHMLGLIEKTTSWGTGIEVQGRAFIDYTLQSYIRPIESMFTSWLSRGVYAEVETDALTRATTKERYEHYQLALGQGNGVGFMNVDEIRDREGLPPLPNGAGQIYYASSAMTPAADADGRIAPAPPAPLPAADPNTDAPADEGADDTEQES